MRGRPRNDQFGTVCLFVLIQVGVLAVFWEPFSPRLLLWAAATYAIRMFGVTAGYPRYFSHRNCKLPWQHGFRWAHVGRVLPNEHDSCDQKQVADLARFPELASWRQGFRRWEVDIGIARDSRPFRVPAHALRGAV